LKLFSKFTTTELQEIFQMQSCSWHSLKEGNNEEM